jgi:hypothetical protein
MFALAACGTPPRKPLPPERNDAPDGKGSAVSVTTGTPIAKPLPAPPAGFATADLVTMRGGELATWSAADGKLTKLGSVALADIPEADLAEAMAASSIGKGNWGDRDHLFLTLAGEREVVMVTATAITRVSIPPAKDFETAKPADPQDDIKQASPNGVGIDSEGLQINDKGEVYWSQCAWGRGYDGYICDAWVHAQLWPATKRSEGPGKITPRSWSWSKTPTGFTASIKKQTLSCNGPSGKSTIRPGTPSDTDELFDDVQWVSTQPPRMLVTYGHPGLADVIPERWTLHDGCKAAPLATGATAEPGPDGFWIGVATSEDSSGPATLYRGAQTLGPLPDHARVMFRPR